MPLTRPRAVRPSSLRDYAYRELRDAIVNGELAPGERLRDPELGRLLLLDDGDGATDDGGPAVPAASVTPTP